MLTSLPTDIQTDTVSCENAVYATQEVVAKYLRAGSHVYMCLYDLQKAKCPILLERLFDTRYKWEDVEVVEELVCRRFLSGEAGW